MLKYNWEQILMEKQQVTTQEDPYPSPPMVAVLPLGLIEMTVMEQMQATYASMSGQEPVGHNWDQILMEKQQVTTQENPYPYPPMVAMLPLGLMEMTEMDLMQAMYAS